MSRYFNSFFIALCFYIFFAIGIFYTFANDKIIIEKKDEIKTISLNHVELKTQIKPIQEEIKKEEPKLEEKKEEVKKELIEKVVETPKPSINKKIEKKIVQKKTIEKNEINTTKILEEIPTQTQKIITAEKEVFIKPVVDEKKEYLDKHLAQIRNLINENVKYPLKAKKLSIEGIVVVRFKILENGTVESIEIIEGHKFLQNATIEAIQEASKSFPKTNKSIEIQIPIEYKLI